MSYKSGKERLKRQKLISNFQYLTLTFFLFLSCSDDLLLYRASSDYFPLAKGMLWTYAVGAESLYVEVIGDSNVYGHFATVLTRNFYEEYWIKGKEEVKKFIAFRDDSIYRTGETIEMGYKLIYKFPLINNATWEEKKVDTVVVMGDSFKHTYTLKGVCSYLGTINSYLDCYKIEFYQERELIGLSDTTKRYLFPYSWVEFLAPAIGVVRKEEQGRIEILTSFRK